MNSNNSLSRGFSLIELMVAMGILSVLMLLLTVLIDQAQRSWRFSESRISQFREARVAFDLITKNVGQASLNTYWEVRDDDSDGLYDAFYRNTELHFLTSDAKDLRGSPNQEPVGQAIFFQAPLGFTGEFKNLNNLFNGRGYFVAFGGDAKFRPSFVDTPKRYRYRLMEFRPPAESNQVFADGQEERVRNMPQIFNGWFKQDLDVGEGDFESHLNPLAENILAIIVAPRDTVDSKNSSRTEAISRIAPDYSFDSNDVTPGREEFSQQVPPLVRVTMIAIDENAAIRFENGSSMPRELSDAVSGLFQKSEDYNEDVRRVADTLNGMNVSHKVFSSLVMLRSSKWST